MSSLNKSAIIKVVSSLKNQNVGKQETLKRRSQHIFGNNRESKK